MGSVKAGFVKLKHPSTSQSSIDASKIRRSLTVASGNVDDPRLANALPGQDKVPWLRLAKALEPFDGWTLSTTEEEKLSEITLSSQFIAAAIAVFRQAALDLCGAELPPPVMS